MSVQTVHESVLLDEIVDFLRPAEDQQSTLFLDGTLGGGGHSAALLERYPALFLIGLDRDPAAIVRCEHRLAAFQERICLIESNFSEAASVLEGFDQSELPASLRRKPLRIDRALLDLGLSSDQLSDPERGFSFLSDGPLDMRMTPSGPTAGDLLNDLLPQELRAVFMRGGMAHGAAHSLARAVVRARPIPGRAAFVQICCDLQPKRERAKGRHPATLPFQALRMAVNDEMASIEKFLDGVLRWLAPNGRLAVIAFHSGEDRVVTHTLRAWSQVQHRNDGSWSVGRLLTKKAVVPAESEVERNSRARSARLRVFERSASEVESL